MKATPWPDFDDLKWAYEKLQAKDAQLGISDLAKMFPWVRVDARLGEILIRHLSDNYRNLDPFALREKNKLNLQPQVLAVLIEFCHLHLKSRKDSDIRDFELWSEIIVEDLKPTDPQMFSIGSLLISHSRLIKQAQRSLKAYRRWGYLGDHSLISQKYLPPSTLTLVDPTFRQATLHALIKDRTGELTVSEYIEACGGQVHRRTAERDFADCPDLKKIGFTRNRRYRIVKGGV